MLVVYEFMAETIQIIPSPVQRFQECNLGFVCWCGVCYFVFGVCVFVFVVLG